MDEIIWYFKDPALTFMVPTSQWKKQLPKQIIPILFVECYHRFCIKNQRKERVSDCKLYESRDPVYLTHCSSSRTQHSIWDVIVFNIYLLTELIHLYHVYPMV